MTGLQEATYIVAIAYMGISLLIIAGLLVAVLVIRHKVISLEKLIKEKLDTISTIPSKVAEVIETVQNFRSKK